MDESTDNEATHRAPRLRLHHHHHHHHRHHRRKNPRTQALQLNPPQKPPQAGPWGGGGGGAESGSERQQVAIEEGRQHVEAPNNRPIATSSTEVEAVHKEQDGTKYHKERTLHIAQGPYPEEAILLHEVPGQGDEETADENDREIPQTRSDRGSPNSRTGRGTRESLLPNTEERVQQAKVDHRSQGTVPTRQQESIQNGNSRVRQGNDPTRRLDDQYRSHGCILPLASSTTRQKISEICSFGTEVAVQSPSNGIIQLPMGLISCDGRIRTEDESAKNPVVVLCRRSNSASNRPSNLHKTSRRGHPEHEALRINPELREINTNPDKEDETPRFYSQHREESNLHDDGNSTETRQASQKDFGRCSGPHGEESSESSRTHQPHNNSNAQLTMAEEKSRKRFEPSGGTRLEQPDSPFRSYKERLKGSDRHEVPSSFQRLETNITLQPLNDNNFGCEPTGVGSDNLHPFQGDLQGSPSNLGGRGGQPIVESEGTGSSIEGIFRLQTFISEESSDTDPNGQHYSNGLHQWERVNSRARRDIYSNAALHREETVTSQSITYPGSDERSSRLSIESIQEGSRLGDINPSFPVNNSQIRPHGLRPVRQLAEHQSRELRSMGPRSSSTDHRLPETELADDPLPMVLGTALAGDEQSHLQVERGDSTQTQLQIRIDRSFVERSIMVSRTDGNHSRMDGTPTRINSEGPERQTPNQRILGRDDDSSAHSAALTFIEQAGQDKNTLTKQRRVQRYLQYRNVKNSSDEAQTLIDFLAEAVINRDPNKRPVYQTFRNHLAAIEEYREQNDMTNLSTIPIVKDFIRAAKNTLPRSALRLNDPGQVYNPKEVIDKALELYRRDSSYQNLRLLALLALRTTALLRGKDAHSIYRSTIKTSKDMLGRSILIFDFCGKSAKKMKIQRESNFIEFLDSAQADRCPARIILKLKAEIEQHGVSHDSLFTFVKDPRLTLKPQSINPLIEGFLNSIGITGHSGHSLRAMTSEYLGLNANIPQKEIRKRGWKKKSNTNDVSVLNYRSRITERSFASILWGTS